MSQKTLFVFTGESFRINGSRNHHNNGCIESYLPQKLATESQLVTIDNIKKINNIDCDIAFFTYSINDKLNSELKEWYSKNGNLIYYEFLDKLCQSEEHFNTHVCQKLYNMDLSKYNFIIIVRIDFYLKNMFTTKLKFINDKVIFGHIDPNLDLCNEYIPSVSHTIMIIPQKYYDIVFKDSLWMPHYVGQLIGAKIGYDKIDFLIYSCHFLTTCMEWNPLYINCGRKYSNKLESKTLCYSIDPPMFYENDELWKEYENEIIRESTDSNITILRNSHTSRGP